MKNELIFIDEADELNKLVQKMSDRQYEQSPHLYDELPERAKRFMKRDFYYGVSYLFTALKLDKEAVFTSYIKWTYRYLGHLMVYVPKEKMTAQIQDFYKAIRCWAPAWAASALGTVKTVPYKLGRAVGQLK